jgi:hypothetical protein
MVNITSLLVPISFHVLLAVVESKKLFKMSVLPKANKLGVKCMLEYRLATINGVYAGGGLYIFNI